MKCPHCLTSIHENRNNFSITPRANLTYLNNKAMYWKGAYQLCPECKRYIIWISKVTCYVNPNKKKDELSEIIVNPIMYYRKTISVDVPKEYNQDYKEACEVLHISPKASATLSRRCLQNILRNHVKVKKSSLNNEIQELLDKNTLPPYLSDSIDAIRNIGNFAAHPEKSKKSNEIFDVEPGEAEWTLEVLESLFDFYFVQPKILETKKNKLNQKLLKFGKPPMQK